VQNYFNYFTEVEEHFQQRRGSLLLLSTLDWALIETWRDAGIPLAAVLRGIDDSFDKYEARKSKGRTRHVNGLAWCAQGVMEAAEQLREAQTGIETGASTAEADKEDGTSSFERASVVKHLSEVAQQLASIKGLAPAAEALAQETATRLHALATDSVRTNLEELEQTLHALESRLLSILLATAPEVELVALQAQAAREIAPYKSRLKALQIRQIEQQFLEKRLLEKYSVPRLSLFYMQAEP
jgi:hypothetical protein